MRPRKIKTTKEELIRLENEGLSEEQIAQYLGCTRMGLYNYRKAIECPQFRRSDKGGERKPLELKLQGKRNRQKQYRLLHPEKTRNYRELNNIFISVVGRPRKRGEIIHHIDGNPKNNKHDNLVICTQTYHLQMFHPTTFDKMAEANRAKKQVSQTNHTIQT